MRKPTFKFPTWSDINQAVHLQKMARGLKFRTQKEEGLYYVCSENKGVDQLRGNREADLRLCFRICICWFSHDGAHLFCIYVALYDLVHDVETSAFLLLTTSACVKYE